MINRLAKLIEEWIITVKSDKEKEEERKKSMQLDFWKIADVWNFENSTSLYHPTFWFSMPKPEAPDNDLSYNLWDNE